MHNKMMENPKINIDDEAECFRCKDKLETWVNRIRVNDFQNSQK